MPAILVNIADARARLPEFIVLDASLVLELRPGSSTRRPHPNHTLATNFLTRLSSAAQGGSVKPILPLLAFEECYFKLCQWALEPFSGPLGISWHTYYKRNPNVLAGVVPILQTFHRILLAFPMEITEPEDTAIQPRGRAPLLSIRIGEFIDRFSVLPRDATILSEAERLGINTVATLDGDWKRANGFTVIAPP